MSTRFHKTMIKEIEESRNCEHRGPLHQNKSTEYPIPTTREVIISFAAIILSFSFMALYVIIDILSKKV